MIAIGVIGLGIMGGAMARHMVAAGIEVHGFDIDPAACARAAAHGVHIAPSLETLCAGAMPLLLSLASIDAVRATAQIIADAPIVHVVVDTSTLALSDKQAIADLLTDAGHVLLDCPISGTGAQMAAGDAIVYASGDDASLAQVMPCLRAFARDVVPLGAFGNGSRLKLIANHLVAIHNVATAEAVLLGMKAGIDPQVMIPAIQAGAGQSRIFGLRAPMVAADSFEPATMKLDIWAKDMAAIADFARATGAATPMLDAAAPLYARALAQGLGQLDTAAVARIVDQADGSSVQDSFRRVR